jgi:hypothetical protein
MITSTLQRICLALLIPFGMITAGNAQKINRKQVVDRHKVVVKTADTLSSLTVGNGSFAFTADVTGLQSFPEYYKKGVPLGTQSEWGWHSYPNPEDYKFEETLQDYDQYGRKISYSVQGKNQERGKQATEYYRVNQHRLQLGNVGLDILKKDGSLAGIHDIKNINQTLDLWTGNLTSQFTVEGTKVSVVTVAHQKADAIAARIQSDLLKQGRIKVRLRFPYPNGLFKDEGSFYGNGDKHLSDIRSQTEKGAVIQHQLDTTIYSVSTKWRGIAKAEQQSTHYFTISPAKNQGIFEITCLFSQDPPASVPSFAQTKLSNQKDWEQFWLSGAAVDFNGSTDKRASELERRVVLSQYLTKVQCSGNFPPQETGLTYNSWYGKPHLEMYWWHAAHFALWGRTEYLEKSLAWYDQIADKGKKLAQRQGFEGIRWQKMTDHQGEESPSSVGSFLIWQQPHYIYLAELAYRDGKDKAKLERYKDLVFATADFMASFAHYDPATKRYNLGEGIIPAQECFDPMETFNPTYELAYWSWALQTAQEWRTRTGLPRNEKWDEIIKNLAPMPVKDGVYLATESTPDCYEPGNRRLNDHPAVLAAFSTLPAVHDLDEPTMLRTFDLVEKVWNWDHTWGWDFPLVAMTATRLKQPDKAVNALFKNITTNRYLPNGHNYQDGRLTIYLPGNGGILVAVALMCAGSDGQSDTNPGFPKDGSWKVKWEGLSKMP